MEFTDTNRNPKDIIGRRIACHGDGAEGIHRRTAANIGEIDDNALDPRRNPHLKDLQQILPFYSHLVVQVHFQMENTTSLMTSEVPSTNISEKNRP